MLNRKGQSTLEWITLFAVVVGAAVAMQVYVKRGLQGRVKDAVDYTGDTTGAGVTFKTAQYEPYYQESTMNVSSDRGYQDSIGASGNLTRSAITEETKRKTGSYEKTLVPKTE